MRSVSVVIPVRDGARFLEELLNAVIAQEPAEVLVIDSGSDDRSLDIVRASDGVDLLEIAPGEFGHGRTRNLGAERSSGELIAFLTQDAVPERGWLDALRESFAIDACVGSAYGPHLPRADTSPMIARELGEFFASMTPNGLPHVQGAEDPPFLSNVNACYSRACWEEIRFADVAYAEDQAFVRAMAATRWLNVYHPRAAVAHAHDYGLTGFAKRYFDEYRGLQAATGHVEPVSARRAALDVAAHVRRDAAWMREQGWPAPRVAAWTGRSGAHHATRKLSAIVGSRATRLPDGLQGRLSLEASARASVAAEPAPPAVPHGRHVDPSARVPPYEAVLRVGREGITELDPVEPGASERRRLHIAVAVPPFRRGSGGHGTIFQIVSHLEEMGHTCTIWVHDPLGGDLERRAAVSRRQIVEWFSPVRAPVFLGFDHWHGADVAMATGWETVHPLALLGGCQARAYMVNDHEPEFFPTSAEAGWARDTYGLGFYPISASPWLRDLIAERYGSQGSWFRLGVDHRVYHPDLTRRRDDTVIFYARAGTPRRAIPLGLLALEELMRRRPSLCVKMFGQGRPLRTSFAYQQLGVATPGQLALNYGEATVGVCLSLTNYSLIPQEMMACGLPCVDVAGGSSEAVFGSDGPMELAAPDPISLADAIEELLEDHERWRARSETGVEYVKSANWHSATVQVERGLREALRERQTSAATAGPA